MDVWSLGTTFFQMVSGVTLLSQCDNDTSRMFKLRRIAERKLPGSVIYDGHESDLKNLSTQIRKIVDAMLEVDPSQRASLSDIRSMITSALAEFS